jgi:hypothetical protein
MRRQTRMRNCGREREGKERGRERSRDRESEGERKEQGG